MNDNASKPLFADYDLRWSYRDWSYQQAWTPPADAREGFAEHLRDQVADPEAIVLYWCDDCHLPTRSPTTIAERSVCTYCASQYQPCASCDEPGRTGDMSYLETGVYWCQTCVEDGTFWCERCDGRYPNNQAEDHNHDCDCPPPTLDLVLHTVDGDLVADDEVEVAIPPGEISEEGIGLIQNFLYAYGREVEIDTGVPTTHRFVNAIEALQPTWNTPQGNYTKRLSRMVYQAAKIKIPATVLTEVGNLARAHSTGESRTIALTRNLNLDPGDFANDGSCWWGEENQSRCILKTNAGFAIRSFTDPDYAGEVTGRVWVLPIKTDPVRPTFGEVDAFVVFNTYGDLDGFVGARVLCKLTGWSYSKIRFTCEQMYVNGAVGYLVAPAGVEIAGISLDLPIHATLYADENSKELTHA